MQSNCCLQRGFGAPVPRLRYGPVRAPNVHSLDWQTEVAGPQRRREPSRTPPADEASGAGVHQSVRSTHRILAAGTGDADELRWTKAQTISAPDAAPRQATAFLRQRDNEARGGGAHARRVCARRYRASAQSGKYLL